MTSYCMVTYVTRWRGECGKSLPAVTNVGDVGVTCRTTLGTECVLD